ncbi:hypothetical protein ABKW02_23800, partial [Enterobacter cloacae]|uniref:hypothetical protein n=1 Tax=Enterobacter cloacae TaxID=550 RepID=UPI0032AEC8C8
CLRSKDSKPQSCAYMDGVLSARIPAALITGLNQQGYQLGLFSSDAGVFIEKYIERARHLTENDRKRAMRGAKEE